MLDIYLDTETTGIDPYNDEIITAYFEVHDQGKLVDSYELFSQVRAWSYEAELVHGISEKKAATFMPKNEAYMRLLRWLPEDFRFITYANKQTMHGTINFDVAILKNELDLEGYGMYFLENNYKMKMPISVHCLAKELKKSKTLKIDGNLSQSNLYYNLFNEKYEAHNAKADVKALVRIHKRLLELADDNKPILQLC